MVAENIKNILGRVEQACFRCNRNPTEVTLVAVTKTFGAEKIREALQAGQLDFGENFAQELDRKRKEVDDPRVRWHFIGHLQTNKVRYIIGYVHLIQTVDNERVAEEIQKRAENSGRSVDVLVEVHTTDEATKFGVQPERTVDLVKAISRFKRLRVQGLMTIGPFAEDPNASRDSFRQLAEIRRMIDREGIDNATMRHLSMGMSHDFEVGIEEGATMVRIGTAIFGKRLKT